MEMNFARCLLAIAYTLFFVLVLLHLSGCAGIHNQAGTEPTIKDKFDEDSFISMPRGFGVQVFWHMETSTNRVWIRTLHHCPRNFERRHHETRNISVASAALTRKH